MWRCSRTLATPQTTTSKAAEPTPLLMSKWPLVDADAAGTPSSSRKIAASLPNVKLRKYRGESRIWAKETTTCLSLGLSPNHPDHKPVVCPKCIWFWEKNLKFGKLKHDSKKRTQRTTCERPFDCREAAAEGKLNARDLIKELLGSDP